MTLSHVPACHRARRPPSPVSPPLKAQPGPPPASPQPTRSPEAVGRCGREGGQLLPSLQLILIPPSPALFSFLPLKYHTTMSQDCWERCCCSTGSLPCPERCSPTPANSFPSQTLRGVTSSPLTTPAWSRTSLSCSSSPRGCSSCTRCRIRADSAPKKKPGMRPRASLGAAAQSPEPKIWSLARCCGCVTSVSPCWDKDPQPSLQARPATRLGTSQGCPPALGLLSSSHSIPGVLDFK